MDIVTKTIASPFGSIRELMTTAAALHGKTAAYQYKDGDRVVSVSYADFLRDCEALGAVLAAEGYNGAHIATVGENSYPWLVTYLSTLMSSGVFVPIDRELPPDSLAGLLARAKCRVAFCDGAHEPMIREHLDKLPALSMVVCFDRAEDDGIFRSYEKLVEAGRTLPKDTYRASARPKDDMAMLVFTSGTTGVAKGVMLTENNLTASVYNGLQCSRVSGIGLSVLPYHHTYAAVPEVLVSLRCGATLFINDSLRNVQKNLAAVRPDYIYLVPMFAELFYNNIQKSIEKKGKTRLVRRMIRLSNLLLRLGLDLRHRFFAEIQKPFGGRLRKIVCGGAPIRPEVGAFFHAVGMDTFGGYGITECSPLVSLNTERSMSYDTAGKRIPCIEWRIDEPNEEGIGEICIKGPVVMKGYYEDEKTTAEVLRGGWFYTGDYGYITKKDQIKITGRKKNIIVLNNGKNIYPEEIEGYISRVPYIEEVVVRGIRNEHGQEEGLSAEVYLGEAKDTETKKSEADILSDVRRELSILPSYKNIARIILRDAPFEKTTTRKIKRKA